MPLTPELIDAAKAELPTTGKSTLVINGVVYNKIFVSGGEFVCWRMHWPLPIDNTEVDESLWPALDRALSRAHLAEARRLGLPAWTLEKLESALGPMPLTTNATKWGAVKEFLAHLKSLPNA